MSRKMKYLTKEKETNDKWFGSLRMFSLILHKHNVNKYRDISSRRYFGLSDEEEHLELAHLRAIPGNENYSDEELREHRSKTERLLNWRDGEQRLFTYHVLNRFLAENNDELTLKEFLDERWDSIIDEMNRLIFDKYEHSHRLFTQLSHGDQYILLIRQNGSLEARSAVESLTVAQARVVIAAGETQSYLISSDRIHKVSPGMIRHALEQILSESDEDTPNYVSSYLIIDQIYRGLSKSIAAHGDSYVVQKLLQESLIYVPRIGRVMHGDQSKNPHERVKAGMIPNGYIAAFAEILAKRGGELHPITYLGTIYALGDPRSFTSEMGLKGAALFKTAYDCDDERKLAFLRAIGEITTRHKGALPTMEHWKDFLFGEGVEESVELGSDFVLTMIADAGDLRNQRATTDHGEFRATVAQILQQR